LLYHELIVNAMINLDLVHGTQRWAKIRILVK